MVDHKQVDHINYYNREDLSEVNKNLPTLVVGWDYLKSIKLELDAEPSVLDNRIITNLLYWQPSFDEERSEHVEGVKNFVDNVPFYYFLEKYQYINLDPLFFIISDLDDLKNVLPNEIDGVYRYKNEMLYILKDNKITGLDLDSYSFYKFDIEDMYQYVCGLVKNQTQIYNDTEAKQYRKFKSKFPYFNRLKTYMLPILILNEIS